MRWYASRGRVETDPRDRSVIVRSATIDVTERKLAEEAAIDLSGRLISAQEDERARLARDLHDGLNQSLALISIELGLLGKNPPATETAGKQIAEYAGRVKDLSTDLRRLSLDLHPSRLEQLGLASSLEGLCGETDRAQPITVELSCGDIPFDLPNDLALCVYRIVQECLQNAVKHSNAAVVSVKAEIHESRISVSVSDDGIGFDVSSAAYTQSLGLVSMRERVRMLKGTFSIDSKPGSGTRIFATIPISA
jgi:signal transduction histidine kinase